MDTQGDDKAKKKASRGPSQHQKSSLGLFSNEATEALAGLHLPTIPLDSESKDLNVKNEPSRSVSPVIQHIIPERKACFFCQVEFVTRFEQKQHFKSDWHLFNLRRKLRYLDAVSEDQFETMASDISSISGSDLSDSGEDDSSDVFRARSPLPKQLEKLRRRRTSSTDSDSSDSSVGREESNKHPSLGRKHPRAFFKNNKDELLSIQRCILHGKKNTPEESELLDMIPKCRENAKWAILMTGGGHFAGAICERDAILVHKTFHRYVVRAKRGTAQSARDAQGGNAPKSAGASLRRHNEAALTQEIQDLIESWSEHLSTCTAIFTRTPTYNRSIFTNGKKSPLKKGDLRVRNIPFPTRRATFSEVKRVLTVMASIDIYGPNVQVIDVVVPSPKRSVDKIADKKTSSVDNANSGGFNQTVISDVESFSSSATASDNDLEVSEISLSTLELKEYDCTKKPRRHRSRSKRKQPAEKEKKVQFEADNNSANKPFKQLRDRLFTACKTGNKDDLSSLLLEINSVGTSQMSAAETKPLPEEGIQVLHDMKLTINIEKELMVDEFKAEKCNKDSPEVSNAAKTKDCRLSNQTRLILNDDLNGNKETLLHIVALNGHCGLVVALLNAGADPTLRNKKGQTPYVVCKDKPTRNEFRRYRAAHQSTFDYEKAQIPLPLTEEAEAAKKLKEAERRKAQKKAKKDKQKIQREEDAKKNEEEREKQRFLQLSDREKRALAAEKRLTQQAEAKGEPTPVLSRCYQCGEDITGKVPFEYYDFKFCTTKCLRQHKAKDK